MYEISFTYIKIFMVEDFFNWFLFWVIIFPFIFMIPHIIINAATEGKFMPYSITLRVLFSLGMGYYEIKKKKKKKNGC